MPPMRRTMNAPKEKFNLSGFNKLIISSKKYLPLIIIAISLAIGSVVCTIIGPNIIKDLVNKLYILITNFDSFNLNEFNKNAFILAGIYLGAGILGYVQQFIMADVTQKISKDLRTQISNKLNVLPLKYFDTTTKGDILSRVTNDVDTISQTLGSNIANLISNIVLFVGVLIMMFVTNYILSFVTIGASLIGFLLMAIIVGRSQKYFDARQKFIGEVNGIAEEDFSNFKIIKSFNSIKKEREKFFKNVDDLYHVTWKANFLSGLMMPIMSFTGNLSLVAIFVGGLIAAKNGVSSIDLGVLASFIIYGRLFSTPLSSIAQSTSQLQQATASSKRVFELLEQKEMSNEKDKNLKLENIKGDVEFRHVRFAYDPSKIIIKDFNAKLKAGQKVAIVGPTGAGKTTMVNLLMRFYELKAPRLIIDNVITEYKVFDLGKSITISFDNDGYLIINNKKTENKFNEKYPLNKEITFDGDLNSNIKSFKLPIISGNSLNKIKNIKLGIAYFGDIFIDGIPSKAVKRDNIHQLFDMILQDTWLFSGSIRDNLIYNNKNISDKELEKACNAVGLSHFINTLPNKFETILGDVDSLSEGQKQQLTIARAIIKNSPMLILDEATSNVDTRTELIIQNAMDNLTKGRTSFVIAHRLSTIKNADVILVMNEGDIVEVGNHKELLKKNGFYASLYNSQFAEI